MIGLTGAPQHYAWGSESAIPFALGIEPDGRPWAELWWGTHPGGRTLATSGSDGLVPLVDLAGRLPFLVKLLAAAAPLSLQAHPTAEQAKAGFAREERLGIPPTAAERVYRDPYPKPELIIAITPFTALCGFRPVDELVPELRGAGGGAIADRIEAGGTAAAVRWLLRERPNVELDHPVYRLLAPHYPADPGALVASMLHVVQLEPGEALFLGAGVLHLYVHGVGLEVMGASDNVMRGGLTVKHVDVDELLTVLDTEPSEPMVLRPDSSGWYPTPAEEFRVQGLAGPARWVASGPEIVVRLAGGGRTAAWFAQDGEVIDWQGGPGDNGRCWIGVSEPHDGVARQAEQPLARRGVRHPVAVIPLLRTHVVARIEQLAVHRAAERRDGEHRGGLHLDRERALLATARHFRRCLSVDRIGGPGEATVVRDAGIGEHGIDGRHGIGVGNDVHMCGRVVVARPVVADGAGGHHDVPHVESRHHDARSPAADHLVCAERDDGLERCGSGRCPYSGVEDSDPLACVLDHVDGMITVLELDVGHSGGPVGEAPQQVTEPAGNSALGKVGRHSAPPWVDDCLWRVVELVQGQVPSVVHQESVATRLRISTMRSCA